MTEREKLEKLLADLKKHKDVIRNNPNMSDWLRLLDDMIAVQKISEEFGIPIPSHYCNPIYIDLGHHQHICLYDGVQPQEGELLYLIYFPTGPYTLGKDYPTKTFNSFFEYLKTYQPKYVDSLNYRLYFTADTAGSVYKVFPTLFEKYKAQAEAEIRQKKVEKLREQLAKLEEK